MTASIDLRQLRYFAVLCEELHFGRAAARLNISQPPLSRQIQLLEEALGVTLFDRDNRRVELTSAAEAFLRKVNRVLNDVDEAIRSVRKPVEKARCLSVGYTTVFDFGTYPEKVFQSLQSRFPELALACRGRHSIALIRDVIAGELDIALIGLHSDVRGLALRVLHEEEMVVALPATDALAAKRLVSFSDLADGRMFWFKRALNPGFYDYCRSYFDAIGFRPTVVPEPSDHHVLLGQIADGQGYALMPRSMRSIRRRGVVFRRLRYPGQALKVGVGMVYRQDRNSEAVMAFMEAAIANPPFVDKP
jgi:DNA-binding transcriptional LysR family regulator